MIREFANIKDLIAYIDGKLVEYRKIFGEVIRYVEDLRRRADAQRKVLSVLGRLGAETKTAMLSAEIDLKSIKLSVNPMPETELRYYEKYLEDLNQKITKLAALRKDLDTISGDLSDIPGKIVVIFRDDIPETMILKI